MSRRKSREIVLCLVFEKDYHKEKSAQALFTEAEENGQIVEIYNSFNDTLPGDHGKNLKKSESEYIKKLFFGVFQNKDKIDELISDCSIGWSSNRISKISMAILRIAVYELLEYPDTPEVVVINEAVELAKKYDQADAYGFINGVLGAVLKTIKSMRQSAGC